MDVTVAMTKTSCMGAELFPHLSQSPENKLEKWK